MISSRQKWTSNLAYAVTVPQAKIFTFFDIKPEQIIIAQIAIRFLLVSLLTVAAVIGFVSLYNWWYNDHNEIKVTENKERLGKMLIMITISFVLLALFRIWVPDFNALSL